jgi:hypothetical protein
MADSTLRIKDGNGDPQDLYVDAGDNGLVPYHAISGAVDVNVTFPATQSVSFAASSVLTASIYNLPLTQSVSLVNTGSLTASLSAADMTTLTASISAVSSAVAHSLDKFIAGLLDNGSSSFNVDIVAGDVNTITQSIGYVKDEVAKLTALSGSDGLKVYTFLTSSVNIANASSLTASVSFATSSALTASISNFPPTQSVSFSTGSVLTASVQLEYSTLVSSGSASYNEFSTIAEVYNAAAKTLTISNQMNGALYIKLDSATTTATNSDYTYVLNATETYEAMQQNVRLHHGLSGSATSGIVRWTYTY